MCTPGGGSPLQMEEVEEEEEEAVEGAEKEEERRMGGRGVKEERGAEEGWGREEMVEGRDCEE